jgi:hypothetical protein
MKIISDLMEYCTDNNIVLLLGDDLYQNAIDQPVYYENNQLIMLADFTMTPTIVNGRLVSSKYSGFIGIGQKREATEIAEDVFEYTQSSLDETFEQKYLRRLKDLFDILIVKVGGFTCDYEYQIESAEMKTKINTFDLNADFVIMAVTLAYE